MCREVRSLTAQVHPRSRQPTPLPLRQGSEDRLWSTWCFLWHLALAGKSEFQKLPTKQALRPRPVAPLQLPVVDSLGEFREASLPLFQRIQCASS